MRSLVTSIFLYACESWTVILCVVAKGLEVLVRPKYVMNRTTCDVDRFFLNISPLHRLNFVTEDINYAVLVRALSAV